MFCALSEVNFVSKESKASNFQDVEGLCATRALAFQSCARRCIMICITVAANAVRKSHTCWGRDPADNVEDEIQKARGREQSNTCRIVDCNRMNIERCAKTLTSWCATRVCAAAVDSAPHWHTFFPSRHYVPGARRKLLNLRARRINA